MTLLRFVPATSANRGLVLGQVIGNRAESDELLLMRHIHALGTRPDGCTWQWAKAKGGRKIRPMGAEKFAEAVDQLVANGYGRRACDQPLTYRALKPMTQ